MKTVSTIGRLNCVKGSWRSNPPWHWVNAVLSGEVECDEVDVVAGHQGPPEAVKKRRRGPSAAFERGSRTEHSGPRKAADSGMIQHSDQVVR